jgi:hypothetical protein
VWADFKRITLDKRLFPGIFLLSYDGWGGLIQLGNFNFTFLGGLCVDPLQEESVSS